MVSTTQRGNGGYAIRKSSRFRGKIFSKISMLHIYYKKDIRRFFLISNLPYVYHYRLISFGMVMVILKNKKTESGLRKLTTLSRKWDTPRYILLCLDFLLNQLWWRNVTRQHVIGGHIPKISVSKRNRCSKM